MRNVVVTGGSRGLGLAIARKLAAGGYNAIAVARKSSEQLSCAMEAAARANTGGLRFVSFDLSDIDGIAAMVRALQAEFGPLYGLVNNAGLGTDGPLGLMHNRQIEQLIRLNTHAPIVLSKYVVRSMMSQGCGRIVNIASVTAFTGYSGLSVYGATKASMIGFTRALAREVGRLGINVNAVAPGFVDTDMTQGMGDDLRARVARRSALRRLSGADEVADSVQFLLGDGAKGITGTVLTVDAGATA